MLMPMLADAHNTRKGTDSIIHRAPTCHCSLPPQPALARPVNALPTCPPRPRRFETRETLSSYETAPEAPRPRKRVYPPPPIRTLYTTLSALTK